MTTFLEPAFVSFLDRMALCVLLVLAAAAMATILHPLRKPARLPVNEAMSLEPSRLAGVAGVGGVLAQHCSSMRFSGDMASAEKNEIRLNELDDDSSTPQDI